jgi:hypothetical protein
LRKHRPIIELLLVSKSDPFAVDNTGNTPASFSRDPKILALLVNPVTAPLQQLCATRIRSSCGYTADDVRDVLATKSAVPGVTDPSSVIAEARNTRGMNPLVTAVIHGNFEVAEILVKLGVDPTIADSRGMSAQVWAQIVKNPRIVKLVGAPAGDFAQTERVRLAARSSPDARSIMFLGDLQQPEVVESNLSLRMSLLSTLSPAVEPSLPSRRQIIYDCPSTDLTVLYEKPKGKALFSSFVQDRLARISKGSFWQAQIEAISAIGSGCDEGLQPSQLVALFMYSYEPVICEVIGFYLSGKCSVDDAAVRSTIFPLARSLWTATERLPPFTAEVYAASVNIDRSQFVVGNEVSSPTFISGTSLWPIAVESLNFEKEGTVFIIKSRNGKLISTHSNFGFESEVVFVPGTKFVMRMWYRGDVIALGQPNIREHTFGLNDEQRATYAAGKKPLIIELHET